MILYITCLLHLYSSRTVSRVMSRIIICLILLLPTGSSDPPKSVTGSHITFHSVLLRMGFTYALSVTSQAVVSYTAFPPLPVKLAVYFCCTILRVTSTGRYPASCPAKPGLSSPDPFRFCQPRLFILLDTNAILTQGTVFVNTKPVIFTDQNSLPL